MLDLRACIGIDISKDWLDLARASGGKPWRRPNTTVGWTKIIADLAQDAHPLIVLEATGPYHQGLVVALDAAHLTPAVINPLQIKRFRQSGGHRAKTDASDAAVLARFGMERQPTPRPLPPASVRALQTLVSRRADLISMRGMELNRLETATLPVVRESLATMIAAYQTGITCLDQEIARLIASDAQLQQRTVLLQSVPGIGVVIAATLAAGLSELGHLGSKPLAALAGVAPFARDSGHQHGQRFIAGGRSSVRTALYQAVTVGLRWNPVMRAHYGRLRARGKAHKVAMIACVRRLLGVLNAMLRDELTWQQTKVGQGQFLTTPT